jgi:serine/threonine protein kinase
MLYAMAGDLALECLDGRTLLSFASGSLERSRLPAVEAHLARCSACRSVLADAARGAPVRIETLKLWGSGDNEAWLAPALAPGDLVAKKYRIEAQLGSGGMGVVFAARHLELGHRVAIKVLHRGGETAAPRFIREARTCARLASDHVPRVFDVGRLPEGPPYIVMEHLVGRDLGRVLNDGPVAIADAVRYVLDAGTALSVVHAAGIVHRDLKPANLFLATRSEGRPIVKVLDFGLSKVIAATGFTWSSLSLTAKGTAPGSPLYMSPEQIRAVREVDARTDIWSLGVILYELLTGQQPFRAPTLAAAVIAIGQEAPPRPSTLRAGIPPALEAAILRCLEKSPEARFPSVRELMRAIQPFAREEGARMTGPGAGRRRGRTLAISVVLLAMLAAAVGAGAVWMMRRPAPTAEQPMAVPLSP